MEGTTGMSLEARVRARLEKYRQDPEYQAEKLTLAVTEEISKVMLAKNVSRAELARRLGVSAARVTNILRGGTNVTLKTVAAVAVALECEFRLGFYEWTTVNAEEMRRWTERAPGRVEPWKSKEVATERPLSVVTTQSNEEAA